MRLVTTSDGTSVTVTGLSDFASANSPRMMRPPCFGWPAGAVVGAGTIGADVVVVCAAAAGTVVAAGFAVAAGAEVGPDGPGCDAGPQADTSSRALVKIATMRPPTAPRKKSMRRFSLRPGPANDLLLILTL